MLEFWKDGKKIEDFVKNPLSQYSYATIFTIVEIVAGKEGYYVLSDVNGNLIKLQDEYYGASAEYLFDAQEWLTWNVMREEEKFSRKQRKIEQLEGHLELLKNILTNQGVRIISDTKAKALGLE